jgi:hypothetical protein
MTEPRRSTYVSTYEDRGGIAVAVVACRICSAVGDVPPPGQEPQVEHAEGCPLFGAPPAHLWN